MTGKMHTIGTRAQVWHGTAKKTSGGLQKSDLMMNKHGRIVSRAKHTTAKKEMRLLKHGFGTKKGKFGFVKVNKKRRSMKGGEGEEEEFDELKIEDMEGGLNAAAAAARGRARGRSMAMAGGTMSLRSALVPEELGNGGSTAVQMRAGMAGGKRRRHRSRKMRGGMPHTLAYATDLDYVPQAGIGNSTDVQMRAGMAGGKRYRRKSRKMSGGTMSLNSALVPEVLGNGGSTDVQMRAGMAGGKRRRHRRSQRGGIII